MRNWVATLSPALILLLHAPIFVRADDIVGVQPAALDQPRVYLHVRRKETDKPLETKVDGEAASAIEAFLDTGASALVLSDETYKALGVQTEKTDKSHDAEYEDVGVGGSEKSIVSEPLLVSTAPYSSVADGSNDNAYSKSTGPLCAELRPPGGIMEMLTGGLDVAGMPLMTDRVALIDPKPLNSFADKLRTTVLAADDARIPKVTRHVPLTYVSFDRFTRSTPGTSPPATAANPLIGPDPFKPADLAAPVFAKYNGKTIKMTMLLDTGAVCSMISRKQAQGSEFATRPTKRNSLAYRRKNNSPSLSAGSAAASRRSVSISIDWRCRCKRASNRSSTAKPPCW